MIKIIHDLICLLFIGHAHDWQYEKDQFGGVVFRCSKCKKLKYRSMF